VHLPGGCTLYTAPQVAVASLTDAAGRATLGLPIPLQSSLVGAGLFAQSIVADPQGAFAGAFTFSQGLDLVIGR
jgi:hypothetical protein